MGVINRFVIQLTTPVLITDLEARLRERSAQLGLELELIFGSPQKEYKKATLEYTNYSNVLNLYFPELQLTEVINGELDYGIADESQAVDTVTYSGFYGDFITDINKVGYDRFIAIMKDLFDAEQILLETL
jgi:hypothetical protein